MRSTAYMSNGYTIAFASTAPVAPANALPHGGNGGGAAVPAIGQEPLGCERTDKSRGKSEYRLRRGCAPFGGGEGRCAVGSQNRGRSPRSRARPSVRSNLTSSAPSREGSRSFRLVLAEANASSGYSIHYLTLNTISTKIFSHLNSPTVTMIIS